MVIVMGRLCILLMVELCCCIGGGISIMVEWIDWGIVWWIIMRVDECG
jgi:hypothetical protein